MRKNWCSILKFVYRQLDVLKSFKCFVFFLCCLSKVAFLTSFTAFLELPLKWGWLLIVFLSGLTLFMMSGVIISDACFQDLSPAMCGLFYQDKNAHHHTGALAYHWLTRTRKHSALRYNIRTKHCWITKLINWAWFYIQNMDDRRSSLYRL